MMKINNMNALFILLDGNPKSELDTSFQSGIKDTLFVHILLVNSREWVPNEYLEYKLHFKSARE
jgi:hypothetical protein